MNTDGLVGYVGEQSGGSNDNTYVSTRLVPERVMRKIELFLSNKRVKLEEQNGRLVEKEVKHGEPLCNAQGINQLLNIIEMMINEHTVQGNFTNDQYGEYIRYCRRELTKTIVLNAPDWDIPDKAIEMIVDSIMRLVKPFISRTIDNLERESLKQGLQSKEVIVRENDSKRSGIGK